MPLRNQAQSRNISEKAASTDDSYAMLTGGLRMARKASQRPLRHSSARSRAIACATCCG